MATTSAITTVKQGQKRRRLLALGGLAGTTLALVVSACASSAGAAQQHVASLSTDSVARFYEQRVQRDPADYVSLTALAGAYLQRARETGDVADYTRAEAALDRSLQILPYPNSVAQAELAVVLNAKHQFAEAAQRAAGVIAAAPSVLSAYAALGDAELALGRYDDAEAVFQKLAARLSGLTSFSRMAQLAQLHGDLDRAEELWLEAHRSAAAGKSENTAWVHVQLGNLYFNQGRLAEAKHQYEQAVGEFPGYYHGLAGLGKAYAAERDFDRAASYYRKAVEKVPLPVYLTALGDVYAALGQAADAQRQYALVDAIDRLYRANGVNTDLEMALFAADHGRAAAAVTRARAAYAARPDVFAADALAWALYQAGQYQEALSSSHEALRLGSKEPLMLFHAGMAAYGAGETGEARDLLGRAVALNPNFSVLYSNLAQQTLQQLGR